jgi:hypothetical protein
MKDGRKVVGFVQVIRVNLSPMSVARREAARKHASSRHGRGGKRIRFGTHYSALTRSEIWQPSKAFGGGMTHWTASVVAILLASSSGVAAAQVDCEAMPKGPARTDCYLGLSQFYRGQSDLAAARARVHSDGAWYRAITGTDPPKHKPHRRR